MLMRLKMFMSTISSSMASHLYNLSNSLLVIGAAFVLLGTVGVVWMGLVKERYSDERTASNEAQTATADATAQLAKKEAAIARLEQERIKTDNLQLEQIIEKERAERLRLESIVSSRKISAAQRKVILDALSGLPSSKVLISGVAGHESVEYARQIVQCLASAGVNATEAVGNLKLPAPEGITFRGPQNDVIFQALTNAGIVLNFVGPSNNVVYIEIGSKPRQL